MKKLWVVILLILFSCQKDELMVVEPYPQYEMIFEESISNVVDGQEFTFEVLSIEKHQLVISYLNGSTVSKETFQPFIGLNTKTIYTKSLPKGEFKLSLSSEGVILEETKIIIE